MENPDPEEKITVQRPEFLPVPDRECTTICLADLTKEERLRYADSITCPVIKKQLEECELSGFFTHCKRDRCKEMSAEKEKDEMEKRERLEALTQRNQILEAHARGLEKQISDYKKITEDRFEKLTNLFLSLTR
jgi:hypothetical protein